MIPGTGRKPSAHPRCGCEARSGGTMAADQFLFATDRKEEQKSPVVEDGALRVIRTVSR